MGQVINHRRDRFAGYPYTAEQAREILFKRGNFNCDSRSLILDHIFLFCLSENSSITNLQLLKPRQNRLKTGMEQKILKQLKKEGLMESVTHYSMELLVPQEVVIKRFKELWQELAKKYPEIDFKTCMDINFI